MYYRFVRDNKYKEDIELLTAKFPLLKELDTVQKLKARPSTCPEDFYGTAKIIEEAMKEAEEAGQKIWAIHVTNREEGRGEPLAVIIAEKSEFVRYVRTWLEEAYDPHEKKKERGVEVKYKRLQACHRNAKKIIYYLSRLIFVPWEEYRVLEMHIWEDGKHEPYKAGKDEDKKVVRWIERKIML